MKIVETYFLIKIRLHIGALLIQIQFFQFLVIGRFHNSIPEVGILKIGFIFRVIQIQQHSRRVLSGDPFKLLLPDIFYTSCIKPKFTDGICPGYACQQHQC